MLLAVEADVDVYVAALVLFSVLLEALYALLPRDFM